MMLVLIPFLFWLAIVVGWVMNIVAIFHINLSAIDMLGVLRLIGIFVAPLGSVLGLFF